MNLALLLLALAPQDAPSFAPKPASPAVDLTSDQADELADLRHHELTSRVAADFSAVRMDAAGFPTARIDMHFGGAAPATERELMELLAEYQFSNEELQNKRETLTLRTILVPNAAPVRSAADLSVYDPSHDLSLEFRKLENPTALSCSTSWLTRFDGYRSTGSYLYWYSTVDALNATTGPLRGSSTDPDINLYYRSGSSWRYLMGSASAGWLDSVGGHNASCYSPYWRVRVHLYTGGNFSVRALTFRAS